MLSGLSGALLPVHLQPKDDELLSSWIIRLAHAHGIKIQTMSAMLFGQNTNIWNRDLDQLAPLEDLKILSTVSGASLDRIEQTTLRSLEGTLFERHTPNGMCRWIIPIGIFHRSRRRPGLMLCPKCLQEDIEPFFRRTWRLAFATLCTKHRCYLLDTCLNCKSPLAPHRSDMQSRAVFPVAGLNVCCWKCGFDYRNPIALLHSVPEESIVTFQAKLENAIKNGFTQWAGNQNMHSLSYFEGLRALIAGITSKQTLERLNKSKLIDTTSLVGWPKNGLEIADLSERRAVFAVLAEILYEWPERLVALITECKLRYGFATTPAQIRGQLEWYWNEIRPILQPLDHVRQVFTSSITKRGLRRSAIGLRFREAITSAGLDQKNVCYGIWKR